MIKLGHFSNDLVVFEKYFVYLPQKLTFTYNFMLQIHYLFIIEYTFIQLVGCHTENVFT